MSGNVMECYGPSCTDRRRPRSRRERVRGRPRPCLSMCHEMSCLVMMRHGVGAGHPAVPLPRMPSYRPERSERTRSGGIPSQASGVCISNRAGFPLLPPVGRDDGQGVRKCHEMSCFVVVRRERSRSRRPRLLPARPNIGLDNRLKIEQKKNKSRILRVYDG